MASYPGNSSIEPAKNEQIITEFFAKSLHIILESRCPSVSSCNYSGEFRVSSPSPSSSSSSSASIRPRDKWFNLALKDCPAALENIDFWRQGNLEPMIADVVLVQGINNCDPLTYSPVKGLKKTLSLKERNYWNSGVDDFGNNVRKEKILERWVVQYESKKNDNGGLGSKRSSGSSSHNLYKKSILLLRSLYVTAKLLPAYKLFRELSSSPQIRTYNLVHRVSTFVEPFTHQEEAEMQRFVFTPIDTFCGRLCLSVSYRSLVSDLSSESSTPMSPKFIQDYVGSPMADPLKMFPSGPLPHHGSPSSFPFRRRHSWSYDLYGESSPPSGIAFPSPTCSETQATSATKPRSHGLPLPSSLPRHLSYDAPRIIQTKNASSYDEYWPSPNFSQSPTPSPPNYAYGTNVTNALLRTESAPVSIPVSRLSGSPILSNNPMLPPSPPLKHNRGTSSRTEGRSSLFHNSSIADKLISFKKEEAEKLTGAKILSNSSPQKSFSRSSSRLSFQDDYDDSEFAGPFVVDDDDFIEPGSRLGSFDPPRFHMAGQKDPTVYSTSMKRSQDAGVAVFCMMKNAPPLHQEPSDSNSTFTSNHTGTVSAQHSASMNFGSASFISPKTTADALEALRGFSELKNSILKQSGKQVAEPS